MQNTAVARVLKPNGEFLLEIVNPDIWVKLMMPIPHFGLNAHFRSDPVRWRAMLKAAGFEIVEEGTAPATLFWLARKHRSERQSFSSHVKLSAHPSAGRGKTGL